MAEHSPEREGHTELGSLSEATGSDGQDGNPLAQAFRKFREGRGREAANLYHDIVKPRQTPVMAHIARGVRYDELGHHELAIEEFLAAQKLDPDNVEVLSHLATTYGALGRFVKADRVIASALRIDSANVQARVCEAILSFRKGLYAEAEIRLKEICDRNPSHGPAHFYRGEALNRLGRVDEALKTMERTIQLQPRNWRAYHTLGMLFDRKEDRQRAAEMYRQARELNPL
jgi:Flp pilus assembly protein TadD